MWERQFYARAVMWTQMADATLIKYHYQDAKVLRRRCALLAFGPTYAPEWPFHKPLYPVWPLPDWSQFENLIGAGERMLAMCCGHNV